MDIHEVFKIYKNTGDTALAQLAPVGIELQIPEPLAKMAGSNQNWQKVIEKEKQQANLKMLLLSVF